jgi:hypothetical protein
MFRVPDSRNAARESFWVRANRGNRLVSTVVLGAIVAIGVILPLFSIELPGPQGDEVYMPYVALQTILKDPVGQPNIKWLGYQLPLTIGPYTGALPVYVYASLMQVVRHPLLFRFVNIFWQSLSIILIFALAVEFYDSQRVGLIAAALFAVLPASVFYSRVGEFDVFLRVPLSIAFLLLIHKFVKTSKRHFLYLAVFLLGLGVNTRLEMIWWLPAVVLGYLLVIGVKTARERLTSSHWLTLIKTSLLTMGTFLLGTIPFSIYVIRDWSHLVNYMQVTVVTTGTVADNRQFWENLVMRFWQLFALLDGTSLRETGMAALSNPINTFVFWIALAYAFAAIVRGIFLRKRVRALELLLCCVLVILVESTITLSLFKPWHILILLPFLVLFIAVLVERVITRRKMIGLLLLAALLLSNVIIVAQDYGVLLGWQGRGGISPGIYGFVDYLQQQKVSGVVTGEWGLARLIYVLSNGAVRTVEVYIYAQHPPIPNWFYTRIDQEISRSNDVWVFYSPPYGDLSAQQAFLSHLSDKGLTYEMTELNDKYGAVFRIYRVKHQ